MSEKAASLKGDQGYDNNIEDCDPYCRGTGIMSSDLYAQHDLYDDYDYDTGYANGEWAFEEGVKSVEMAAAMQTMNALLATDQALYSYRPSPAPASGVGCEGGEVVVTMQDGDGVDGEGKQDGEEDGFAPFDYDRYYHGGVGYDAHRDAVDEAEV
jgi:hypothetical protein